MLLPGVMGSGTGTTPALLPEELALRKIGYKRGDVSQPPLIAYLPSKRSPGRLHES